MNEYECPECNALNEAGAKYTLTACWSCGTQIEFIGTEFILPDATLTYGRLAPLAPDPVEIND